METTLLILAAGLGSRFGGLKQMEPVGPNGEWILDYSVYDAIQAGFSKVVFVIRKDMESSFRPIAVRNYGSRIAVEIAFQDRADLPVPQASVSHREKPWGTGHAVYSARKAIREPFAVINADDFYGRPAYHALHSFLASSPAPSQFALVGYKLANTLSSHGSVSRGICLTSGELELTTVAEHTEIARRGEEVLGCAPDGTRVPLDAETLVSLNCWAFPAAFLPLLGQRLAAFLKDHARDPRKEFYLPAAVDQLIQAGMASVSVLACDAKWLGITHRDDLPLVRQRIASLVDAGHYPSPLWSD